VHVPLHRSTHMPQVITPAIGMIAVRLGFLLCISVAMTADTFSSKLHEGKAEELLLH